LKDLRRHTTPLAPAFIIINESKEKHVENKAIEEAKWAQQLVEIEQPTTFSSKPIEGGFFYIKACSPNIPIVIPTKFCSKYIMRCWGKE